MINISIAKMVYLDNLNLYEWINIPQSTLLPCQALQHQVVANHSCDHKGAFELFYCFCVARVWTHDEELKSKYTYTYLDRNLRNCKHLEMIISLGFISVSAAAEACLSVGTSPAGFSRNIKFSTSVNTPVNIHWTYVNVALCNYDIN